MDVHRLHFANKGNMCFENFTAFVGLEVWPDGRFKKQHLEIFNLQCRWENLKEFRKTVKLFGGAGLGMS